LIANWPPAFAMQKLRARLFTDGTLANGAWLFADQGLRLGVGLLLGVWVARYLGPLQYGQLNFATAFVTLFGGLSTLGLNGIVIRELVLQPVRRDQLVGVTMLLKSIGAAIGLLIIVGAALATGSEDALTVTLVAIIAFGTLFQAFDAFDYWFQSQVQARYTVYSKSSAFLIASAVKVALLLQGAPLIAFAWVTVLESAVGALGLYLAYRAQGHGVRVVDFEWPIAKELLSRSWPLFLSGVAVILYVRLDVVMLGQMVGKREAGIYAAATRLSEVCYVLPTIIVTSVAPAVMRLRARDRTLYLHRLRRLYFLLSWLAIIVSLPITLLAPEVVQALYGAEFSGAAPVLAIHMWASIAVFLGVASGQYLIAEDLQSITLYRTLIGLAMNVLANLLLIPRYGGVGAAIATVVSYYCSALSIFFFKRTRTHAVYLLLALVPPRRGAEA
jgi:polysaccharide transporter, PST family